MHSRREFLAAATAAALAAKAPAAPAGSPGIWRNRHEGVSYRRLGRTNYMISEIVMGGNGIRPDHCDHVAAALDLGLNYLDTAAAYGRGASESGFGRVIRGRARDSFFLNTKVSVWRTNRSRLFADIFQSLPESEQSRLQAAAREELEKRQAEAPDYFCDYFNGQRKELQASALANVMEKKYGRQIDREKNYKQSILDAVDESLRRLGCDDLDLVTCPHGANSAYELLNFPEIFEAFEKLKKAGKVRHLSVSAHSDPAGVLEAAVEAKVYSAAMVAYNVVNHRYVDAALQRAKAADLGVIAMKVARPVYNGRGLPDAPARVKLIQDAVPGPMKVPQKAYLWALRNPNIAAANSDMLTSEMVRENLKVARPRA